MPLPLLLPQDPIDRERVLRDVLSRPLGSDLRFGPSELQDELSSGGELATRAASDGSAVTILFVILIVAVAAVIAVGVVHGRSRAGSDSQPQETPTARRRTQARADREGDDPMPTLGTDAALAAARAGQHAQALHTLLLTAIDRFESAIGRRIPPRTTTRELMRGVAGLPPISDPAFAALATVAERARFAGCAVGERDWDAGWNAFERLRTVGVEPS